MNLCEKLFKLQGLTFAKDASNPFFKSKYLTLDKLLKELNPILEKNNLLIFHYMKEGQVITRVTNLDSAENEDFIESAFPVQQNIEPQKVGSAITYAKRYNIGQIFNIITDSDDDGNVSSPQNAVPQKDEGLGVCSICGENAKMSKAGNPFCPNIKDHIAKKEKYTIVKKPTKAEKEFDADLDATMDEINYDA